MTAAENEDQLVEQIVRLMIRTFDAAKSELAQYYAGADGDEAAAMGLIQKFVTLCDEVKITTSDQYGGKSFALQRSCHWTRFALHKQCILYYRH